ncbi:MAG TPA: hypothetical protein PK737_01340 [Bacilli bacterium]|nr:hypothetical protein [Bacilli bacterium]
MKKIWLLIVALLLTSGCTNITQAKYDRIIANAVSSKLILYDQYRSGYKYYLPKGLIIKEYRDFNEIITDNTNNYFLYVDAVSYYNHVVNDYQVKKKAYYSQEINYEDRFGYLEVNQTAQNKYLIEIMYNYAKIEVIVDKGELKRAITNAINILSSIKFNNQIIAKKMSDEISLFNEVEYNIFKTNAGDSIYLYYSDHDNYEEKQHDSDLIE